MSKLVVISLLGGNLNQGFPIVTAQLSHNNQFFKITGSLPAVPELNEVYKRWQLLYEAVHQRMGNNQRIKMYQQDVNHVSVNDFDNVCKQLQSCFNTWLKCESFQNIERQLRTLLSQDDEIRIIIETDIILLHRLPWHLWDFFDHYPKAEIALSNHEYASPRVSRTSSFGKVRILAVLGNSSNIDINEDRSLLENLKDAQTTFIVSPTRIEIDELLWNQDWDILFFAGHSGSDNDIGKIYINHTESLTVPQLKNALSNAIERGLKLAIFNSCDGISLARNCADLNIPQIIIMRERVPNLVAQKFLKNFLFAFALGKPLYIAMREARAKLQGLENNCPCASWLPVIYQNPTTVPTTWQELCSVDNYDNFSDAHITPKTRKITKNKLWLVLIVASIVTISVISLRYLGTFEKTELQTFNQMMVLRPREEPDERLLVVKITEENIQSSLKSISDNTLAKLLNKLQQQQDHPPIIGLDIYRDVLEHNNKLEPIKLDQELNNENVIVVCKGKDSKYDPQGIKSPEGVPETRQGFNDAIEDLDNVVRRHIFMMKQEYSSPCKAKYSFASQLALRYLFYQNAHFVPDTNYITFTYNNTKKVFNRLKPGYSGGYQQENDLDAFQMLINYRNSEKQSDADDFGFKSITLNEVMSNHFNTNILKNKIVIIGVVANSIRDDWSTPYTQKPSEKTSGVFIHAQMVSQIISAVLDDRPIFWVLPYWGDILWIWGWTLISSLITWRLHTKINKASVIVATVVFLYGICTLSIFLQGLWLPFVPSVFAVVASSLLILFTQRRYR